MTNSTIFIAEDQASRAESVEAPSTDTEATPMVPHATHLKALADKDAIEDAIRHEADPRGMISRDTIDTAGLVKYLRKQHRDNLEEQRKERDATRIEKEGLHRIIRGLKDTMRSRDDQEQQIRDDYCDLDSMYKDLLEDNKAKEDRITELKKKVEATVKTCKNVTKDSVDSLRIANRKMEHRIVFIKAKYDQELAEIRGTNVTLQNRLDIARRLQPVIILHEARTVCETHEKLLQMKKAKEEELVEKDKENEELRTLNNEQERQTHGLEIAAEADARVLQKTSKLLRDTQMALSDAESEIRNHQQKIRSLDQLGNVRENSYNREVDKVVKLRREMDSLADQRLELIWAQAKNEGLQKRIDFLQEDRERLDNELEAWENGDHGTVTVSLSKNNHTESKEGADSLAKGLNAANAELQASLQVMQAERDFLAQQLGNPASVQNPQSQEQVERLECKNRRLRMAAKRAKTKERQLMPHFKRTTRVLKERIANKTQDLQVGLDQLHELQDQWLLQKRGLEEQHDTSVIAKEAELQSRINEATVALEDKEKDLQSRINEATVVLEDKEKDLQNREAGLATRAGKLDSDDRGLSDMQTRAENAEKEVTRLQMATVDNTNLYNDSQRHGQDAQAGAEEVEKEVPRVQAAPTYNEAQSLRRDGMRHLDLLNETTQVAGYSRAQELHHELQTANGSLNYFAYHLLHLGTTESEDLKEVLYGADFDESDKGHLQDQGRPVLLAQLQGAKRTMIRLRYLLAEGPKVAVDRALSIVMGPRGDEDAAKQDDDIFGPSYEDQQPIPRSNPRKRSGAPLSTPRYSDHYGKAASDDIEDQDQGVPSNAGISTHEGGVDNRRKVLPKSRRIGRPANPVPPVTLDPVIGDQ